MSFFIIVLLPKFYHSFHFYSILVQLYLSTSGRQFPAFILKVYQKALSFNSENVRVLWDCRNNLNILDSHAVFAVVRLKVRSGSSQFPLGPGFPRWRRFVYFLS